jgi:hypothetical protein
LPYGAYDSKKFCHYVSCFKHEGLVEFYRDVLGMRLVYGGVAMSGVKGGGSIIQSREAPVIDRHRLDKTKELLDSLTSSCRHLPA